MWGRRIEGNIFLSCMSAWVSGNRADSCPPPERSARADSRAFIVTRPTAHTHRARPPPGTCCRKNRIAKPATDNHGMKPKEPKLHDNAPKKVTTPHAVTVNTVV